MKKTLRLFAALLLFVTPYAEAKTCSAGVSCNYIDPNPGFESGLSYWTTGGAMVVPGNCSSNVAELDPGDYVQRSFYVDDAYTSYKLQFRAWLVNDNDNYYDQLKVRVTNNDTGVYEELVLHGLSFNNGCGLMIVNLTNDYDFHNVTVKFYTGGFTIRDWQVDDVGFFGFF